MDQFKNLFFFLCVIWLVFFISRFYPILNYGIKPRNIEGLLGILTAPFLHANYMHVLHNSISLLIFGTAYCLIQRGGFLGNILFLSLVAGLLTWAFGRTAVHIGASGVVFGLWSHLLFLAWFHKKLKYFFISSLVFILYGSMITGILPKSPWISWESHLAGFLAGILSAKLNLFQPKKIL